MFLMPGLGIIMGIVDLLDETGLTWQKHWGKEVRAEFILYYANIIISSLAVMGLIAKALEFNGYYTFMSFFLPCANLFLWIPLFDVFG